MTEINKRIGIVFVLLGIFLSATPSSAQDLIHPEISFDISFPGGSSILETNFQNNNLELGNIRDFVNHNKYNIQSGNSHFVIVSYIKDNQRNNLYAINRSSLLASVVRAYLKTRYGFNNSNFSFVIRPDAELSDLVRLEFKPYSIKPIDNQDIYFALKPTYQELVSAISRYRSIPYDLNEETEVVKGEREVHIEEERVVEENALEPDVSEKQVQNKAPSPDSLSYTPIEQSDTLVSEKEILKKQYVSFAGMKTNLINLAGVTPPAIVAKPVYNITLEFYYLKRSSIAIEGYISPLLKHSKIDSDSWFKRSGIAVENRIWIGSPYKYKGFYAGLYGLYGEFDIRDIEKSEEGETGSIYSFGLSIGYALPISKRIFLEAGIRGGYQRETGTTYLIRDGGFYLLDPINKAGLRLVNYNFSFVYRFLGKQKNIRR
ncbi:MAG: DUF3575 domain-containing protein [Bacteroidales bacterium]|nr:DUF3575 domain-containing protein [Bacteroidales bacterium]